MKYSKHLGQQVQPGNEPPTYQFCVQNCSTTANMSLFCQKLANFTNNSEKYTYELLLPLIAFNFLIFLLKKIIILQNIREICDFLQLRGDFSYQSASNSQ